MSKFIETLDSLLIRGWRFGAGKTTVWFDNFVFRIAAMIVAQRLVHGRWLIFNVSVITSTACTGRSRRLMGVAIIVVGGLAAAGCRMRSLRWIVESVVVVVGWRRHRHRYHGHWRTCYCVCTRLSVSVHRKNIRSRLNSSTCFSLFSFTILSAVHRQ